MERDKYSQQTKPLLASLGHVVRELCHLRRKLPLGITDVIKPCNLDRFQIVAERDEFTNTVERNR